MDFNTITKLVRRYYLFTPGAQDSWVQIDEACGRVYDVCQHKTVRQTIRFIMRRNEIARQLCQGTYGLMPTQGAGGTLQ